MKRVLLLMILALAVGALAPTAHAVMSLKLYDGTNTITISDGGIGDNSGTAGVINWTGTIGIWDLNVTTGISKPWYPAAPPKMDLNSVNANSSGAGTLAMWLSDQDFSFTSDGTLISAWGGTTDGSVSLTQIFDPDNSLYGTSGSAIATPVSAFGPAGTTSLAFSDTKWVAVPGDPAFSLTEYVTIAHRGTGSTSFNATSTVVPVPGAVILGILGLGAAGIKLRKYV